MILDYFSHRYKDNTHPQENRLLFYHAHGFNFYVSHQYIHVYKYIISAIQKLSIKRLSNMLPRQAALVFNIGFSASSPFQWRTHNREPIAFTLQNILNKSEACIHEA